MTFENCWILKKEIMLWFCHFLNTDSIAVTICCCIWLLPLALGSFFIIASTYNLNSLTPNYHFTTNRSRRTYFIWTYKGLKIQFFSIFYSFNFLKFCEINCFFPLKIAHGDLAHYKRTHLLYNVNKQKYQLCR